MNRVVIFAESVPAELIAGAFSQLEPVVVGSRSECANALVAGAATECLVVQLNAYGQDYQAFLSSIKEHFPLLEVLLIAPNGPTPLPEGCHFVADSAEGEELAGRVAAISGTVRVRDHRHGIRYDWPLGGRLRVGTRETPCKVRSFSFSGAFLETDDAFRGDAADSYPEKATLMVEFLNAQMTVRCEIVRRQDAGPGGPAGYGVRFLEFSRRTEEFCERIVRDAVLQALLNPDEPREVPTLIEEGLSIPGYDQPL